MDILLRLSRMDQDNVDRRVEQSRRAILKAFRPLFFECAVASHDDRVPSHECVSAMYREVARPC